MKKLAILLFILMFSGVAFAQSPNPIQEFTLKDGFYQLKMYTLDVEFYIDGTKVTATSEFAGYPSAATYKIAYISGTRLTAKSTLDGSVIDEIDLTPYKGIEIKFVDIQGDRLRAGLDKIYDKTDLKFYIDGREVTLLELMPMGCCANSAFLPLTPGTSLKAVWVSTGKESTFSISSLNIPTITLPNNNLQIQDVYLDQGVSDYYVNVKIKNNGDSINLENVEYKVLYGGVAGTSSRWMEYITLSNSGNTIQKMGVIIAGGASKTMQCNNPISITLFSKSTGSIIGSYNGLIRCVSTTTTTYYRTTTTTTLRNVKPDLFVKQINQLPSEADIFDGQNVYLSVDVKNFGNKEVEIGKEWLLRWYVDDSLMQETKMGYAPTGDDTNIQDLVWWNSAKPGMHTIKVSLDEDNRIGESDETNNVRVTQFFVKSSQLSATYFLGDEGKDTYDLYIMPTYPGANSGDILIGAAFSSGGRVIAFSNNPNSRSREVFALDPFVNSFKIGSVNKADFSQFDKLEIGLEYNGDKKSIAIPLSQVEIRKIVRCTDTDSGINFFEKGTVTSYKGESNEIKSTDYCRYNDKDTDECKKEGKCEIYEYYCNADGSIGEKVTLCPSRCLQGRCTGGPQYDADVASDIPGAAVGQRCHGCMIEDDCLPYGIRKTMQYCSTDGAIWDQKSNKEQCENNFECTSNLCIDGQCVPKGVFKKFSEWFSSMFG